MSKEKKPLTVDERIQEMIATVEQLDVILDRVEEARLDFDKVKEQILSKNPDEMTEAWYSLRFFRQEGLDDLVFLLNKVIPKIADLRDEIEAQEKATATHH